MEEFTFIHQYSGEITDTAITLHAESILEAFKKLQSIVKKLDEWDLLEVPTVTIDA